MVYYENAKYKMTTRLLLSLARTRLCTQLAHLVEEVLHSALDIANNVAQHVVPGTSGAQLDEHRAPRRQLDLVELLDRDPVGIKTALQPKAVRDGERSPLGTLNRQRVGPYGGTTRPRRDRERRRTLRRSATITLFSHGRAGAIHGARLIARLYELLRLWSP